MSKVTPFLWFTDQAEEAINFYVSVFTAAGHQDSKLISLQRYGPEVPGLGGKVLTAVFELAGQKLMAIDGGPEFKFTEAISLFVDCDSQGEVDFFWDKLGEGGKPIQCGWLKDKYGLSWQIIPKVLGQLLSDPDPAKAQRVMAAMLKMKKIEIAGLTEAYNLVDI
jgi:predicted 3-demethylubiquinone-9 3-methyltransferase (glyoxalase superfamily)